MQITVHYIAQLKRAAGRASEAVAVEPGTTLAQLVRQLTHHQNDSFRAMVLDAEGHPQRALLYAVGDAQADLEQVLIDGDTVTLLAPMAGG